MESLYGSGIKKVKTEHKMPKNNILDRQTAWVNYFGTFCFIQYIVINEQGKKPDLRQFR